MLDANYSLNSIIYGGLFAVLILVALLLARRSFNKALPYPPGPKPLPFLGNVLDIPRDSPWLTFSQWAKEYGEI